MTPNLDGRAVGRTDYLSSPARLAPALGRSHVQQYQPLLPFAIEQIDLGAAELVISSSHLMAKGVLTAPDQLRISFASAAHQLRAHTRALRLGPDARLSAAFGAGSAWSGPFDSLAVACSAAMGPTQCSVGGSPHRQPPFHGASNPQILGAGGQRDRSPPHVELERFHRNADRDDVYLCLCRLVPCKRVDLAV